jgi:putative phosphoribosyl transferase
LIAFSTSIHTTPIHTTIIKFKNNNNRKRAGQFLASLPILSKYSGDSNTLVLALPRGGVPVAYSICKILHLPLDLCIVRKLGFPYNPEVAMGALCDNVTYVNEDILGGMGVSTASMENVITAEKREAVRREKKYRSGRRPLNQVVAGKTILLVDDGIATGATTIAACKAISLMNPRELIVVAPVGILNFCSLF